MRARSREEEGNDEKSMRGEAYTSALTDRFGACCDSLRSGHRIVNDRHLVESLDDLEGCTKSAGAQHNAKRQKGRVYTEGEV